LGPNAQSAAFPSFEGVSIRTARLYLRPFQASDATSVLALFMDEGFMEHSPAPMFTSIHEAHEVVVRDAAKLAAGERLRLGIVRLDDATLIGYCDLFDIDRKHRKGEIGYGLLTRERGHGFMNEALAAFLNRVLCDLQFNRVIAEIDPGNISSEKTVQRLGFTKEAHLRDHCDVKGVLSDSFIYGLLRRDLPLRPFS
jgi:RimJ/RimL family protein N-acetyltransferase